MLPPCDFFSPERRAFRTAIERAPDATTAREIAHAYALTKLDAWDKPVEPTVRRIDAKMAELVRGLKNHRGAVAAFRTEAVTPAQVRAVQATRRANRVDELQARSKTGTSALGGKLCGTWTPAPTILPQLHPTVAVARECFRPEVERRIRATDVDGPLGLPEYRRLMGR